MPGTNQWAVIGALALKVDYTRKYGFDTGAAAKINARLVAVPPPSLLLQALQANLSRRAQRAVAVRAEE
jgi:hypothetical protein